jgi:hypothetical protein
MRFLLLIVTTVIIVSFANAQMQVSKEPRHKPVLENKYIRLLDVWLASHDTTYYHVHSTPSLFIYLTNNRLSAQVQGAGWVNDSSLAGKAWYRSFQPDSLIHRLANADDDPLHVNDIEILSSFNPASFTPLQLPVIFDNERSVAYQYMPVEKQIFKNRGPVIAELVYGDKVKFHNISKGVVQPVEAGSYVYVEPGTSFGFSSSGKNVKMVLFEIK